MKKMGWQLTLVICSYPIHRVVTCCKNPPAGFIFDFFELGRLSVEGWTGSYFSALSVILFAKGWQFGDFWTPDILDQHYMAAKHCS